MSKTTTKRHRGYDVRFTRRELLDAIRGGQKLRWLPHTLTGKSIESGRRLMLGTKVLSVGEEFMVIDMAQEGQLWQREKAGDICDVEILESALPDELKVMAPR